MASLPDTSKSFKLERHSSYLLRRINSTKILAATSHLLFRISILATVVLILLFTLHYPPLLLSHSAIGSVSSAHSSNHRSLLSSSTYGGAAWEREVRRSATPHSPSGLTVLVTGAAGFVGTHCSLALKKRGDGVVGLDNFNNYYDPALKRARQAVLARHGVLVLDADINDSALLAKLFDVAPFTHVLHLAAQAGVRYAMRNPQSYVASNVAGLVALFEVAAKHADPQPAVVWASSSSVYGLNTESPFSELHRTDRPASLYAATKKAGEAIAHTYNHIYGLSITGLRFFTVYGPWGRPDMAYFSFTNDILSGKPITLFRTHDGGAMQRNFTYIDNVVRGCLSALDTVERSTGSGGMFALAVDEGPGCSPEEASHYKSRKDQSSASSVPAATNASKAFSVSGVVSGGEFTLAEGPSTAAESAEGCLVAWRAVAAWICWWVRGQAAEMQGRGESGKLSHRPHVHRRTPLYRIFPTADAGDGALPPPVFFPIITKESVVKKRPAIGVARENFVHGEISCPNLLFFV